MPHRDYLVLTPETSHSKVCVVGDVHGEMGAFNAVLSSLSSTDTLIVAGDLIDRGQQDTPNPGSPLVLDKIIELNGAPLGTGPRVYAIKGNHEQYFLKTLNLLRDTTSVMPEAEDDLMRFIKNGGGWIFKHPEPQKDRNLHTWMFHYEYGSMIDRSEPIVRNFIQTVLSSTNRFDYVIEDITKYEDYIQSLPYIIKINDPKNVAWVAHADLIFSDEELDAKIDSSKGLDADEIEYVTEARPKEFQASRRLDSSCVVYCGHNIIDEPSGKAHPALPVRRETKHINLDVGAYFTKGLLLLNHTDSMTKVLGDCIEPDNMGLLTYAKDDIQDYLTERLSNKSRTSLRESRDIMCELRETKSEEKTDSDAEEHVSKRARFDK